MRVLLVLALLSLGCEETKSDSTTGVCGARVKCANDNAPAFVDQCNDAAFDPKCGTAYQAYFACLQNKQVCDGRGHVDVDASAHQCPELGDAWGTCLSPAADTFVEDTRVEDTIVDDTGSTSEDAAAD